MILGFKQQFQDKTPTNFREKILSGEKIHTIRAGTRWRAGMPIQMAYGVRTKNYDQFNVGRSKFERCTSAQPIFMTFDWILKISIGARYLGPKEMELLITNDGVTISQFTNWFFPQGRFKFSGQIIHWTDFKY